MKRREFSLHYCNACKATTRHIEEETTSTCIRCGTVKQATRVVRGTNRQTERHDEMSWN
jgi:hypothetical protein